MSTGSRPEAPVWRTRLSRVWRVVWRTVAALVVVLTGTICVVLFSATGTAAGLGLALDVYNDTVRGNVSVAEMDGTLGSRVYLRGVELTDAEGTVVLTGRDVEFDPDLGALMGGVLSAERLAASGMTLDVGGAWSDLEPWPEREDGEDADPSTRALGPSLPAFWIRRFELKDGVVLVPGEVGLPTRIGVGSLEGALAGHDHAIHGSLLLTAAVARHGLVFDAVKTDFSWNDPVLRVESLTAAGNTGTLELRRGTLDASDGAWGWDALAVALDPEWLRSQLPALPAGVNVKLEGSATMGRPSLVLHVEGPSVGRLAAKIEGVAHPHAIALQVSARCTDCGAPNVTAEAHLEGAFDPWRGSYDATASVHTGSASLGATAVVSSASGLQLSARWAAGDLSEFAPLFAALGAPIEVSGAAHGSLLCRSRVEPEDLRCDLDASISNAALESQAHLAGAVTLDPKRLGMALSELEIETPQFGLELADGPATLSLEEQRVDLVGLTLRTTDGRVAISADGAFDLGGESDVRVRARGVDISAVGRFLPDLAVGGVVDADVRLVGDLEEFLGTARISGRRITYRGANMGTIDARVTASSEGATATVTASGGIAGRATASLAVPLELDTREAHLGLGRGPVQGALDVGGIEVAQLGLLVPQWRGRGTASVSAKLSGTLARPMIALTAEGRGISYAGIEFGRVEVSSNYRGSRLEAKLVSRPPHGGRVDVDAHVPAALNLAAGRWVWQRDEVHELRLRAAGLDVAQVGELLGLHLEGRGDLDLTLQGGVAAPLIEGRVAMENIVLAETRLGRISASFDSRAGRTRIAGQAAGPLARSVDLTANVPVSLDVLALRPNWDQEASHEIELRLEGVALGRLRSLVPELGASGELDGAFSIRGAVADPRVEATAQASALRVAGVRVRELDVDASYRSGMARFDAVLASGSADLRVRAVVPADLDLLKPSVTWRPDRPHELVAEIDGIDDDSLRAFVELPEDLQSKGALRLNATGSLEHFVARGVLDGNMTLPGEVSPLQIALTATGSDSRQRFSLQVREDGVVMGTVEAAAALDVPTAFRGGENLDSTDVLASLNLRSLPLARLARLLPFAVHGLRGTISGRVELDGTVGDPELHGSIELEDGEVTIPKLRQKLEAIALRLEFSNKRIKLAELAFKSGRGGLEMNGHADITADGLHGELRTKLSKLPVREPSLPTMLVTADMRTQLDVTRERTDVAVVVSAARVDVLSIFSSGAKAIPTHPRLRYVGADEGGTGHSAEAAGIGPDPRILSASVELAEPLEVRGPLVAMAWEGAMTLEAGQETKVRGRFDADADASTFDLLGTTFTLERGAITPAGAGDLSPFVDIRASARLDGVTIDAGIRGVAPDLELRLSSSPPYEEQELFAMIATGTADVTRADVDDSMARAASALAAFTAPALQQSVGEALAADSVRLSFGDSLDEPALSVGRNVRKRLYIEGTIRSNVPESKNGLEMLLRYKFLPQWTYEVFVGDADVSGMGLWWVRLFDVKLRDGKPKPSGHRAKGGAR